MNSVIDSFTMSAANKKDESTRSPLILDGHQWQNIVKQLRPEDEALARREKEREYEEYLKNGSRSMTKHWTNSVEKIRERENLELLRAREKKRADGKWRLLKAIFDLFFFKHSSWFPVERCFRELKETDEKTRKEQIAYAEQLLKRLQPGPKQLEGAYAWSVILHEQQKQREARRQREQIEREKSLLDGELLRLQAQQWIDDQIEQMRKYRERCADYKRIICHDIDARTKERLSSSQRLIELEQMERDANEQQMQKQLRKERETSQQRREQFRNEVMKSMQRARQEKRSKLIFKMPNTVHNGPSNGFPFSIL